MARIYYSVAGEGRGHATRARALVEHLGRAHEIVLFASGHAYGFLAPLYNQPRARTHPAAPDVRVEEIPGLFFRYDARGRLAYGRTGSAAARYVAKLPAVVRELTERMSRDAARPDLVLSDFEGALPRAARRAGIPFLSVDHQHFLTVSDLGSLPRRLRLHAHYMDWIVRGVCRGQQQSIVSSFYFPPLKPRYRDGSVVQVGVLLRPEVLNACPETGEHLCVYLRRAGCESVLQAIAATNLPVHVFGLGSRPPSGRVHFHAIDESRFVHSLATCRALVCTAGNQLVGEAHWLGKPVFAMPEPQNHEQFINAHFLAESGGGTWRPLDQVTRDDVHRFLDEADVYRAAICPRGLDGTLETVRAIERWLPAGEAARPAAKSA